METDKELITQEEYYQLQGLRVLAEKSTEFQMELESAVASIIGEEKGEYGYDWSGEIIWHGDTVDSFLEKVGLKVDS